MNPMMAARAYAAVQGGAMRPGFLAQRKRPAPATAASPTWSRTP